MKKDLSLFISEASRIASKHVPTSMRTIAVKVHVSNGLKQFNHAFVQEAGRKNPLMADRVNLTEEELYAYEEFLLKNRVDVVKLESRNFKQLKRLAMPCFVERVLTDVGEVMIRDRALSIKPVYDGGEVISLEEAIAISDKVDAFYDDLAVVEGAMPGDPNGNPEVMTLALIEGYVMGMGDYNDPLVEYICYALGLLMEETQFNALYYMRYDDVRTIECNMAALGRAMVV